MRFRRALSDIMSILSALGFLAAFTWIFDLFDMSLAGWIVRASSDNSPGSVQAAQGLAREALGIIAIFGVMTAGFIGGRFVSGRPLKLWGSYFLTICAIFGVLWLTGDAFGLITPELASRGLLLLLFNIFMLFSGWLWGVGFMGDTSDHMFSGSQAGVGAAGVAGYAAKHRDDTFDVLP